MQLQGEIFRENSLPKGVTDFLPEQAESITRIEAMLGSTFELWGFKKIIPPLLEFEEMLAIGVDEALREKSFRFEDRQSNRLIAIPPDITPQVARIEAMRMNGYPLPHRLYYNGRVLRHVQSQSGRSREIFQSGVELIGLDSPEADAEMIAMSAEVLQKLGFDSFKIDLGQVEFYRGIMSELPLNQSTVLNIQEAVGKKDVSTVTALLEKLAISDRAKNEISALPRMFGGIEVLEKAAASVTNDRSRRALENLVKVVDILAIHGIAGQLTIDLGEIRGLSYHSGVTFEGFVPQVGEPVCGGGRYDGLMGRYGKELPATGFAFNILALLQATEKNGTLKPAGRLSFLIFNNRTDRCAALQLSSSLRSQGYPVTRDIIRRDLEQSMQYAERSAISHIVVVPAEDGQSDRLQIIRVADRATRDIPFPEMIESLSAERIADIFQ